MKTVVIGLKELNGRFAKLEEAARGKVLETALVAGALIINNDAKRNAPWVTGTLRRSIHVGGHVGETVQSSGYDFTPHDIGGDYSDVGGNKTGETDASVLVGTNLVYARKIEYGGSKKAPNGYLRRAFDENTEKVKDVIGDAIKILINKAAK